MAVEGVRRLLAVTCVDDLAAPVVVIGGGLARSAVPDATGLEVRVGPDRLWATWTWPAEASLAYVVLRCDRFADAADAEPRRRECLRHAYEAGGGFECPAPDPPADALFVTVFAAVRTADGVRGAPGASRGAGWGGRGRGARLYYRVAPVEAPEPPGWRRWLHRLRRWARRGPPADLYELRVTAGEALRLPELWLAAASDAPPDRREAGAGLLHIAAGAEVGPGRPPLRRRLPRPRLPGRCCARLFAADAAGAPLLDLIDEGGDGGRLY